MMREDERLKRESETAGTRSFVPARTPNGVVPAAAMEGRSHRRTRLVFLSPAGHHATAFFLGGGGNGSSPSCDKNLGPGSRCHEQTVWPLRNGAPVGLPA